MARWRGKKETPKSPVRTAEQAGEAINIDLCFVPQEHDAQEKLPAVSGSSGHLVVERLETAEERPTWPGQVFGDAELTYEEAMQQYLQATQDRQSYASYAAKDSQIEAPTHWRQEWEGRAQRHQVLQQRKQEDADWKAAKDHFRQAKQTYHDLPKDQRKPQREAWKAEQAAWKQLREQRLVRKQTRKQENGTWHQRNRLLKEGPLAELQRRVWIAILVVTDNCTRQCLGLPLFRSGARVTSREVVTALKFLLPTELRFVISDQGKHFHSKSMAQLAQEKDFAHVLVYRHRPESNGIAERFVLTFKDWLRSRSWQSLEKLEEWVEQFQSEYNDRPHQGLGIPGLSPNEFAGRIWLM